ncbi:hypothetical protein SS50377_22614 [Spironucleus salmonicida]|uniref:Uncharacterized protein n=1 Tax=Spironucleus salmonicida TaxID=348837 RepID=A0A9P8RZH4_9EUKA|nr:hypothetical protein SS50377_22614 [Spironucleus salmonicida]
MSWNLQQHQVSPIQGKLFNLGCKYKQPQHTRSRYFDQFLKQGVTHPSCLITATVTSCQNQSYKGFLTLSWLDFDALRDCCRKYNVLRLEQGITSVDAMSIL